MIPLESCGILVLKKLQMKIKNSKNSKFVNEDEIYFSYFTDCHVY